MSKGLTGAAAQEFDDEVHHQYQGGGNLRETITQRSNVVGSTYQFRRMGKGLGSIRGAPQTDVIPMDVAHVLIPAVLEDWVFPEFTDIFDQAEVNFEERTELAMTIGMAMGRREDQLIIDAFDAIATYAGTVTTAIGGAASNLNVAKLRRAARLLDDQGVPGSDRHLVASTVNKEALLAETETTSSDFNTVKALVDGQIKTFLGFAFHWIEDRSAFEGGLTIDGGDVRDGFAYHKAAMGIAYGALQGGNPQTKVDWVPVKTSWLSNGMLKAGVAARDGAGGVVKVQMDET